MNCCIFFKDNNFPIPFSGKIFFLSLLFGFMLLPSSQAAKPMLPQTYNGQTDIRGWVMSEKLDGVRGYWDGKQLLSKNGYPFDPPAEFISNLPDFPLEGELWSGRDTFEQTASTVRHDHNHFGWKKLKFAIFDVPKAVGGFTERIALAKSWVTTHPSQYAFVISQLPVRSEKHLQQELKRIEKLGGEGLIVRKADALYSPGRSSEILKVKNYHDAEATVIAHVLGKGDNSLRLGSLLVRLEDGTQFKIGTGFSHAEREHPPPIGAIVTFKHYGKYRSGIPKFPVYLRIRHDNGL